MQDSMSFDTTPVCENCVQVPYQDGGVEARKEAVAFINQLKRQFGEQFGVRMVIKSNPHDFGNYFSVEMIWDDQDEEAENYVYNIESHLPEYWDEEARKELGLQSLQPRRCCNCDEEATRVFDDGKGDLCEKCFWKYIETDRQE